MGATMADLPRSEAGNPTFMQMLASSMIDGGIFASLLVPLALVASPLFGYNASSVPHPLALLLSWGVGVLYGFIPVGLIALALMAPLAVLFARPVYRRGFKSHAVYIALGALVGLLTPLALVLICRLEVIVDSSLLLLVGWFVVSSAFGGWSFADRLSRQITSP